MAEQQRLGQLSEYFVAYTLAELGFEVSIPTGGPRYDLIAEKDKTRYFIQVKSCEQKNGSLAVVLERKGRSGYTTEEVDLITVHDRTENKVYYVPTELVTGKTGLSLRLTERTSIGGPASTYAKDYETFPYK